jgi:hypothetical protein
MKLSIFEILDDQIEAVQPAAEATPEVIEQPAERLPDEKIVELWEGRSASQETDNRELIEWWYSLEHPLMSLRRYCDLIAAPI